MWWIKYFIFAINLFLFMLNIVTLLLESVPCCQMYLFHHVRCIGVSSDSMLLEPTEKKKMHDFLTRQVFARVRMVQSFSLSSGFSLFPSSPHTSHPLCSKARPAPSPFIPALIFYSTDPLKPNKRTKEVASVVFERFCSCSFLLLFLNQLRSLWRLLRGDHIHCLDVLEILWGVPKIVPK